MLNCSTFGWLVNSRLLLILAYYTSILVDHCQKFDYTYHTRELLFKVFVRPRTFIHFTKIGVTLYAILRAQSGVSGNVTIFVTSHVAMQSLQRIDAVTLVNLLSVHDDNLHI